jgi:hypothetical protein
MKFCDQNGLPLVNPKTGEELNIALEFEGTRNERRPARIGITFCDASDSPLFICANEVSHEEALGIGAGDRTVCRIPRLPLSAGRYKIDLFLERNGIIEDWLEDPLTTDVVDGSFFGTSRNLPIGWEARTVLVDHEWLRISADGDSDPLLTVATNAPV